MSPPDSFVSVVDEQVCDSVASENGTSETATEDAETSIEDCKRVYYVGHISFVSLDSGLLMVQVPIDLGGFDPGAGFRAKLVGKGGVNVKHIQQTTGTSIAVRCECADSMSFAIYGSSVTALGKAVDLCVDLLGAVLLNFYSFA